MFSLAKRIQERLEDAHIVKKGGSSGKKQEAEESQGIVNYIASCEKKWTELARNSFNNNELFQNVEASVNRLYQYCTTSREGWRECESEMGNLTALQDSIAALSASIEETMLEARRIEECVVPAMVKKNEKDLEQLKVKAEAQIVANDRQFTQNVNRLKAQHESFAQEVAQGQASYNPVQKAADEIRNQLANSANQVQYQNLDDVQLDIKIDKKFRVKDIR